TRLCAIDRRQRRIPYMTLNITVVAPWGVWQSSDHRLTDLPKRDRYDDNTVNTLKLRCRDGFALVTYTGIGKLDGINVCEWRRSLVGGKSRPVDETLIRIREEATVWLGQAGPQYGLHHTFAVGAFIQGKAWAACISNVLPEPPYTEAAPLDHFGTSALGVETD